MCNDQAINCKSSSILCVGNSSVSLSNRKYQHDGPEHTTNSPPPLHHPVPTQTGRVEQTFSMSRTPYICEKIMCFTYSHSVCLCDCVLSIALHTHPHIDARQHILGLTYKRIDYQQFVIEYIMNHLIGYGTYIFTRINVSQIKKCMRICIFAQYLNTREGTPKKNCVLSICGLYL